MEEKKDVNGGVAPYTYWGNDGLLSSEPRGDGFLDLRREESSMRFKRYRVYVKRVQRVVVHGIKPERQPNESYWDYRLRKDYLKKGLHNYKRGTPIYLNQRQYGQPKHEVANIPYSLKEHGTLAGHQKRKILKRNDRDKRREERRDPFKQRDIIHSQIEKANNDLQTS